MANRIEQGLMSPQTQYRSSGRQFYRSKYPTNTSKVLKEVGQAPEEDPIPPGTSHRITSEPLSHWVEPSKTKPHTAGWPVQVLYRLCNNKCYKTLQSQRTWKIINNNNIDETINSTTV